MLVANATEIGDGSWASLDGRAIYAEARTAGFIHEAAFRRELSHRLGVAWTEARNGIGEIEGVPRAAIDAFSRRKAEIDANRPPSTTKRSRGGCSQRRVDGAAVVV